VLIAILGTAVSSANVVSALAVSLVVPPLAYVIWKIIPSELWPRIQKAAGWYVLVVIVAGTFISLVEQQSLSFHRKQKERRAQARQKQEQLERERLPVFLKVMKSKAPPTPCPNDLRKKGTTRLLHVDLSDHDAHETFVRSIIYANGYCDAIQDPVWALSLCKSAAQDGEA